ncbi:MAG TPA: hypothetical protein PLV68_11975, partial [Ilumatobacteraceae bacterium]|nr:hypothetical protein [Ilumatobacteraceae bacterium]
ALIRPSRGQWFLWQGEPAVAPARQAVLLEMNAMNPREVPTAAERPGPHTVAVVRRQAQAVVAALHTHVP